MHACVFKGIQVVILCSYGWQSACQVLATVMRGLQTVKDHVTMLEVLPHGEQPPKEPTVQSTLMATFSAQAQKQHYVESNYAMQKAMLFSAASTVA
jgi:hypothetical protein